MQKLLLLGDEAIAQAALDAGISSVNAYPGTPSTEITEYIQASQSGVRSQWSANEKTAMEAALGVSYAGKRALVCMKHVGMNVAADAFINAAVTGVNGGLVVVCADDPSMHSSQNEQDSRFYGKFAMVPLLEPSNQQEAYDITRYGFDLSEQLGVPVILRITTRLAHSRSGVVTAPVRAQNELKLPADPRQFILLPAIAKARYKHLQSLQPKMEEASEKSVYNQLIDGADKSLGIIACGLAYNYLMENYPSGTCPYPVLKVSQYPVSKKQVQQIYGACKKVLVLEEGFPMLEEQLRGLLNLEAKVSGRMDGTLPFDGELTPNLIAEALGLPFENGSAIPAFVANRPPALCNGCGHIDLYNALNEVLESYSKGRVFADIGCYTLGALPPYSAINSCVDMGASITMAKGASDVGMHPTVAVIGDSTFTHSGMTGLLDCINDGTPITVLISDNSTTGMTGGQKSSAFERIEQICAGLGVEKEHLRVITPLKKNHAENIQVIKDELEYKGVSVIIARRECIQTLARRHRK